jgi:BirA family biotin operon repressor/biotin-[acetyl-CoA-carboxylase] ligase
VSELSREVVERLESPLAKRIYFHEEIDSTQKRARALAQQGAPHGTLVIAGVQTDGRGRLGRKWGSPLGGIWMSLVLRPEIPAHFAPRITQAAAVGVAKTLWSFGVEARIEWPNDLLVEERKICGILAESGAGSTATKYPGWSVGDYQTNFVVLGVGLNANLDAKDLQVTDREVATIRFELGHDVDLSELLGSLLSSLDAELKKIESFGAVLDDWRALNCTLGKFVRVRRFGQVLEGRAVDLTLEGALLLETPDGTVELFEGEVEHLRQEGGT